jgi:uncharacterized membrane protein
MWWIQTTGYHLAGLIWLIVIAVLAVIAIVSLSTAGAAASDARRTRRMVRDHEAYHLATGAAATQATAAQAADTRAADTQTATPPEEMQATVPPPEPGQPVVVEEQPPAGDTSLGDSMRILHERYARGEITREEYLQAREDMMAMTR